VTWSLDTLFPLLGKELSEAAQRRRTYVVRFIYTAILFGCGLLILYGQGGVSVDSETRLGEGRAMFTRLVALQFAGIYLFLPAMTAGAFAGEKERDTLTLLLLTTMNPWTIVIQKLLSRVIPMLCYVVLSFPLMAVAYSYGGVTTASLYSVMWMLVATVIQVGSLSLMCSAFCRTTVEAFIASFALIAVMSFCVSGSVIAALLNGPVFSSSPSMIESGVVATGLTTSLFFSILYLIGARAFLLNRAFVPPRNVMLEFFQALDSMYQEWNAVTGGVVLVDDDKSFPDRNPIAWRETRKKSLGTFRYLFRVLVVIELPILVVTQQVRIRAIQSESIVSTLLYFVWIVGAGMVCIHAASVISSERSRQTWDSLLTIPVSGRTIILEKLAGVFRLINVLLVPFATIFLFHHWLRDFRNDYTYLVVSFLMAMILPRLLAWFGFWMGMHFQSQIKAVMTTFGVVAVVVGLPALLEFIMSSIGWAIPGWLDTLFMLSPASMVIELEQLYQYRGQSTDAQWWFRAGMFCTVLIVYGMGLFFMRRYCLKHADRLLGRVAE